MGPEGLQDSEFSLETPGTTSWTPGLRINEAADSGGSKPQNCNRSQLWRPGVRNRRGWAEIQGQQGRLPPEALREDPLCDQSPSISSWQWTCDGRWAPRRLFSRSLPDPVHGAPLPRSGHVSRFQGLGPGDSSGDMIQPTTPLKASPTSTAEAQAWSLSPCRGISSEFFG